MKSRRCELVLRWNTRVEVAPGVWENSTHKAPAVAVEESVYQVRADQAMRDGLPITARFRVRGNWETKNLDYVERGQRTYKVRSVRDVPHSHWSIIETGELI